MTEPKPVYENVTRREQVGWRIACALCHKKFVAKRKDAKTCSSNCRQLLCRDRLRERESKTR